MIANSSGAKTTLFVPEGAFEQLARLQIKALEQPSLTCADLVHEELRSIAENVQVPELQRFTALKTKIMVTVHRLLERLREPAIQMIKDLVEMEQDYINMSHPDFIGSKALDKVLQKRADREASARQAQQAATANQNVPSEHRDTFNRLVDEKSKKLKDEEKRKEEEKKEKVKEEKTSGGFWDNLFGKGKSSDKHSNTTDKLVPVPTVIAPEVVDSFETELITTLLESYYGIMRKIIKDKIPKIIMHFMVNNSKLLIQNELVQELYKDNLVNELLVESESVVGVRNKLRSRLEVLVKANAILSEVETS